MQFSTPGYWWQILPHALKVKLSNMPSFTPLSCFPRPFVWGCPSAMRMRIPFALAEHGPQPVKSTAPKRDQVFITDCCTHDLAVASPGPGFSQQTGIAAGLAHTCAVWTKARGSRESGDSSRSSPSRPS